MNKDIIYIDVEDDITAIIGKVKDAKEKIVALVPPKRIGVLQSAVNLRLLARAAGQADKRLVLITNNAALTALAAAAKLPIAKNLQSKPEIAQIPVLDIDDGNDVIDGAQLPVGDLQRTADIGTAALSDPAVDEIVRSEAKPPVRAVPPAAGQSPAKGKAKSGTKVPNFSKFRKKLLIIIAAIILFLGFLVWAIFFAPRATVVISARTTDQSMNKQVVLGAEVDTSASASTLKTTSQQLKKDVSESFDATGKKEVGDKATGTVKFSSGLISSLGRTIPEGTVISSGSGMEYTTDADATMEQSGPNSVATVTVTAKDRGAKYNGANGSASGAPSGVSVDFIGSTGGGTDKTVAIVTKDDIQRATDALKDDDESDVKKKLAEQFGSTAIVIDASFTSNRDVSSSPAAGQEVSGQAKLTGSITYELSGVAKNELDAYLKEHFTEQLDNQDKQRIYDNGADTVTFTNVSEDKDTFTANLSATAKVGPKIDDSAVKELAKGKRYGEIQSSIVAVQGVDSVDIKFWPFWVSKAPDDVNKIKVEFKLDESQ